jgi:hypothetical protein
MAHSMAGPQTSQSRSTDLRRWCSQLVAWLAISGVAAWNHLEFGLAVGFAGCLLFAVRWAFGPESGKVFFVGFALGVVVEWTAYSWIEDLVISGRLGPQAFHSVYPFTFQYWKVWPSFEMLQAQGGEFSSRTALNSDLAALGAGSLTSGIFAGLVSLLAWYRFGVRRFFERSITPTWRQTQQFAHAIGQRKTARLAFWLCYGIAIAILILATWWAPFGRTLAISVATLILALCTLIGWLNARNSVP